MKIHRSMEMIIELLKKKPDASDTDVKTIYPFLTKAQCRWILSDVRWMKRETEKGNDVELPT